MGFSGKLHTLSLGELLEVLHLYSKSGVLRLQRDHSGETGEILLRRGMILRAHVSGATESICEILLSHGAIDETQMTFAIEEQRRQRSTSPVGHLLVSAGATTMVEVRSALMEQVESALREMFGWADGFFAFEALECRGWDEIHFHPLDLVTPAGVRERGGRTAVPALDGGG